jgi:anaerobic ribonucleoside-triphosphate reductase activating protein
MSNMMASIAQIVPCTEAESPGRRFAVWFQGCPLRCLGCCNPEMLPFDESLSVPLNCVIDLLRSTDDIEGISLLGGEPFAHMPAATALAQAARNLGLSVMIYSGFVLNELRARSDTMELLSLTDVLVDGPYFREQPETTRRWVGSANQVVHFLTHRYRANDPCWRKPNTLEIRLQNGELMVNGFPSVATSGFWRRSPRSMEVIHG